ncbi:MAG: tRNA (adenosine(37)-N6)-threonylcarbamoyltransferase complex dimerization subunit type 1 TsaB [Candidatus Margulisbacteria bacterium]|nr:tRNA (adenosine(37)-N6)-threonylcarbamoyltransferase complex dimerization subunit type 1 TsaB [Candidatus Margulisiibacteriota bacterium]
MVYLGINTAVAPHAIGIYNEDRLGDITQSARTPFAEQLILEIKALLNRFDLTLGDLKGIGVLNGPGAYTGLRLGITVAKSLGQVQQTPVYGISTMDAIIQQVTGIHMLTFTVIPARQNEYHVQLYANQNGGYHPLSECVTLSTEAFIKKVSDIKEPVLITGIIAEDVAKQIQKKGSHLYVHRVSLLGTTVAKMAQENHLKGEEGKITDVFPKYSHEPNIGKRKKS